MKENWVRLDVTVTNADVTRMGEGVPAAHDGAVRRVLYETVSAPRPVLVRSTAS